MTLLEVPKLRYQDTSKTQSEQMIREIRQSRLEMNHRLKKIEEIEDPPPNDNSPYLTDRQRLTNILGSQPETAWKEMPDYQLRKLNIL